MSKNKDAKRKAKQKAKLAQAAQQEQARIEHIANAVMEICSPAPETEKSSGPIENFLLSVAKFAVQ